MTTGEPPTQPEPHPPGQALTPSAALGWLRSLSVDITAAAVVDDHGRILAGDAELAENPDLNGIMTARSGRLTVLARVGPKALRRLVQADLQAAADVLHHS